MTYPPTLLHALERYILEDKILHMLARYNCRYPDADISSIHKIFAAKQSKTIQTIESELHSLLDNTTLVLPTGEQIYLDRFRFTVRAKDRSGSIYISPTYALATRKEYAQWGIPLSECSFLGSTQLPIISGIKSASVETFCQDAQVAQFKYRFSALRSIKFSKVSINHLL